MPKRNIKLKKIKEALFTNLKKSDIIPEYKSVLEKIIELIIILKK